MQIVIFHYHLNPGGVTRIIESQIAGFRKIFPDLSLKVITGYCEDYDFFKMHEVEIVVNPILNYLDQKPYEKGELEHSYKEIYQLISDEINDDGIIHAHNINLGKNPLVTLAVNQLFKKGVPVINHAHDFSEDRPNNQAFLTYIIEEIFNKDLMSVMYPQSKNYKVGVLNHFDYDRVLELGIDEENALLFPNPVYVPFSEAPDKRKNKQMLTELFSIAQDKIIITYPVRVIERKNIGEILLLSTLYKHCQFMVTMAPRNPVEIEKYQQWKSFCEEKGINVIFEAGEKANFIEIISGSDYCITTSKKEGFGMAYLEPWLIGTPVIGRDINYVTKDIKNEGVIFSFLYEELLVDYKCQTTDFKSLSMFEQQEVIQSVCDEHVDHKTIEKLNPSFTNFPPQVAKMEIKKNQETIIKNFSIEEYAKRIHRAYNSLS